MRLYIVISLMLYFPGAICAQDCEQVLKYAQISSYLEDHADEQTYREVISSSSSKHAFGINADVVGRIFDELGEQDSHASLNVKNSKSAQAATGETDYQRKKRDVITKVHELSSQATALYGACISRTATGLTASAIVDHGDMNIFSVSLKYSSPLVNRQAMSAFSANGIHAEVTVSNGGACRFAGSTEVYKSIIPITLVFPHDTRSLECKRTANTDLTISVRSKDWQPAPEEITIPFFANTAQVSWYPRLADKSGVYHSSVSSNMQYVSYDEHGAERLCGDNSSEGAAPTIVLDIHVSDAAQLRFKGATIEHRLFGKPPVPIWNWSGAQSANYVAPVSIDYLSAGSKLIATLKYDGANGQKHQEEREVPLPGEPSTKTYWHCGEAKVVIANDASTTRLPPMKDARENGKPGSGHP